MVLFYPVVTVIPATACAGFASLTEGVLRVKMSSCSFIHAHPHPVFLLAEDLDAVPSFVEKCLTS